MKVVEVRPTKKFRGAWVAFEAPGVEPAFQDKEHAISYAKGRFGGFPNGEIHVYDDEGESVAEVIKIDGGAPQYGQPMP